MVGTRDVGPLLGAWWRASASASGKQGVRGTPSNARAPQWVDADSTGIAPQNKQCVRYSTITVAAKAAGCGRHRQHERDHADRIGSETSRVDVPARLTEPLELEAANVEGGARRGSQQGASGVGQATPSSRAVEEGVACSNEHGTHLSRRTSFSQFPAPIL